MPASQYLAAISLLVADYDEAIAFYCGQLGFVLLEDSPQGEDKRWVRVGPAGATTQFVLAKAQGEQQLAAVGNQGGGRVWLFLYTDDFAADYQRMQGAGVRFLEQPRQEPYGTVAVFEDLYGNKWDLLQPR